VVRANWFELYEIALDVSPGGFTVSPVTEPLQR